MRARAFTWSEYCCQLEEVPLARATQDQSLALFVIDRISLALNGLLTPATQTHNPLRVLLCVHFVPFNCLLESFLNIVFGSIL